jgi:hypothetical protein
VDINDMGSGVSVRWLEDFSDATARDSTIPVNLPGREASATGTEDIEWVGHPVNDRLAVHKDGFWLEAEVKHSDSGVESAPLEWADVPGLAAALDAIDLKGATDKAAYEIVALRDRIKYLEGLLESERAAGQLSSVFVVYHRDRHGDTDVQAYRSKESAQADFAGKIREEWEGQDSMDDARLIAEYLERNADVDLWLDEVGVNQGDVNQAGVKAGLPSVSAQAGQNLEAARLEFLEKIGLAWSDSGFTDEEIRLDEDVIRSDFARKLRSIVDPVFQTVI